MQPRRFHRLLIIALALFSFIWLVATQARADLTIANLFTDGAVLQREHSVPVWGRATPAATITINFAGQAVTTNTDGGGTWQAKLTAMPASAEPQTLTVRSSADDEIIEINDVLVGEVWLCSGQSNMAMPVARARDAQQEIASATFPALRVFTVARKAASQPLDECSGTWLSSSPDSSGRFSATAWFFGREIHRQLDVPVGLIVAAWSGSAIEAWTSAGVQNDKDYLQALLDSWREKDTAYTPEIAAVEMADYEAQLNTWQVACDASKAAGTPLPKKPRRPIDPHLHHHHPAVLYNGMINPLVPYAMRGAIWYQGETNGLTSEAAALYDRQLPLLVNDWRQRWNQGDFPMAWMQLPFVSAAQVDWPPVREAMRLAQRDLPNTGMAVTLDLGEERLLHPTNKQAFAHRLALWARAQVYGEDISWSGPLPVSHQAGGSGIVVAFSHTEEGLVARDSYTLTGFEICGSDSKWHPAKATIDGDLILISNEAVATPVAVRYAWANHPQANLFNGVGLPASPFQLGDSSAQSPAHPVNAGKKSVTPPPSQPPLTPIDITVLPDGSKQLDIFLLLGQSNMKGRGDMPGTAADNPKIAMMHKTTDQWFVARHPLHLLGDPETFEGHDNAGVGPGLAFAETILRHRPETRIGLVPCAAGGTRIGLWQKGQRLYEDAIRRAKLALENGPEGKTRIAGVLWLQGEADAQTDRVPVYAEALADLVASLRSDLGDEHLPFLVSTIGELRDDIDLRKQVNSILLDLANEVPHTAAIDARDLTGHIGDHVHFDTASQNEIGRRFGRAWLKMPIDP